MLRLSASLETESSASFMKRVSWESYTKQQTKKFLGFKWNADNKPLKSFQKHEHTRDHASDIC